RLSITTPLILSRSGTVCVLEPFILDSARHDSYVVRVLLPALDAADGHDALEPVVGVRDGLRGVDGLKSAVPYEHAWANSNVELHFAACCAVGGPAAHPYGPSQ